MKSKKCEAKTAAPILKVSHHSGWSQIWCVSNPQNTTSFFSCMLLSPAKPADRQEIRLLSGKEGCECSLVVVFFNLWGQFRTLLRKPYWWEFNHRFKKFTNVKALETSTAHNFRVGTVCLLVSLVLDEISCCWWEWKQGKLKLLHFFFCLLFFNNVYATHSSILAWEIPRTASLVICSPWGRKGLDTTEWLNNTQQQQYTSWKDKGKLRLWGLDAEAQQCWGRLVCYTWRVPRFQSKFCFLITYL